MKIIAKSIKPFIKVVNYILIVFLFGCGLMFIMQEKLIFFPKILGSNFTFNFDYPFEEITIPVDMEINLHGLLFKADSSKGLIFYLHGNAGTLDSWGWSYQTYINLNYSFFILDYRGYGNSNGDIESEAQLFNDVQTAYDQIKNRYNENEIIVIGYSMGTGPAAKIASENSPRMLILQAPYYSLIDMKDQIYPFLPDFMVKYKFETYKYLDNIKAPVYLFHGDQDEVIYHGSSVKLQKHLKPTDKFITLKDQPHNGMNDSPQYQHELKKILQNSF